MNLSFKVFGFEVARVELELGHEPQIPAASPVTKAVKAVSWAWVKGMMR